MKLPKPTVAPKPKRPQYLFFSYLYAFLLLLIAVWQLVGVGIVGTAPFVTADMPVLVIVLAAAEIFSLPFLLMLHISPLARMCSAALAVSTPFIMLAGLFYQGYYQFAPEMWWYGVGAVALAGLSLASFMILDGAKAMAMPRRK